MSEEQKTKDLCKTCEYYWEDFPLPLEYVVPHCDKIDEKFGLSKNMDNFVPYPCVECPFDSYKKSTTKIIKRNHERNKEKHDRTCERERSY